jgi:NADH:ubiquinone oxidoreductase subunit 4 (subunit M)
MVLDVLEIGAREFVRRIGGIALCAVAAGLVSFGVHLASTGLPGVIRFASSSAVMLIAFAALLARYQSITLRSVVRSLRGS